MILCHGPKWMSLWGVCGVATGPAGDCACICVCLHASIKHPTPHNRKRWGEARVYWVKRPQRSFLFWHRAAALRACFSYWTAVKRCEPGTRAGKHDTSRSFDGSVDGLKERQRPSPPLPWAETGLASVPTERHSAQPWDTDSDPNGRYKSEKWG